MPFIAQVFDDFDKDEGCEAVDEADAVREEEVSGLIDSYRVVICVDLAWEKKKQR